VATATAIQTDVKSLGLDMALLKAGVITRAEQEQAREKRFETDQSMASVLVELKLIDEEQLLDFYCKRMGFEAVSLEGVTLDRKACELIPKPFAQHKRIVPVRFEYDTLVLAMEDPSDSHLLEDLRDRLNLQIKPVVAKSRDIDTALAQYPSPVELPAVVEQPKWLRIVGALFLPVALALPIVLVMGLGMQDYFARVRNIINTYVVLQWHTNPYEFVVNFCVIYGIWSCVMWLIAGLLFPSASATGPEE